MHLVGSCECRGNTHMVGLRVVKSPCINARRVDSNTPPKKYPFSVQSTQNWHSHFRQSVICLPFYYCFTDLHFEGWKMKSNLEKHFPASQTQIGRRLNKWQEKYLWNRSEVLGRLHLKQFFFLIFVRGNIVLHPCWWAYRISTYSKTCHEFHGARTDLGALFAPEILSAGIQRRGKRPFWRNKSSRKQSATSIRTKDVEEGPSVPRRLVPMRSEPIRLETNSVQ